MLGNIIADTFIKPFQSPVFDNPANYALDYEDVSFKAADGVELSGWLIKGSTDKVIIQSHFGVQCSRSGYTPKGKGLIKGWPEDVRFLRQAKALNEAGYTVLMYDFRNHGNSGLGTLPHISWGQEEAKDVVAAVNFIHQHADYQQSAIGLLSICMGQGATVAAFGMENGLANHPAVKTMISVQPMDYGCFVDAMGLPNFIARSTDKAIKKRTGFDFNSISWRPCVSNVDIPTLVIQNRNDGYLNEDFVESMYADINTGDKKLLWIDLPKRKSTFENRLAAYNWIGEHPKVLIEWFDQNCV